jgi:hypothetical protein
MARATEDRHQADGQRDVLAAPADATLDGGDRRGATDREPGGDHGHQAAIQPQAIAQHAREGERHDDGEEDHDDAAWADLGEVLQWESQSDEDDAETKHEPGRRIVVPEDPARPHRKVRGDGAEDQGDQERADEGDGLTEREREHAEQKQDWQRLLIPGLNDRRHLTSVAGFSPPQ